VNGWTPFTVPRSIAGGDSRIVALSRRPDNIETWSFGPDDFPQGAFWYADGQGWRLPYPVPGPISAESSGIAAALSRCRARGNWESNDQNLWMALGLVT
jgi:hypothetical protein